MFNTQRLSLARRRRGMTKKGLADAVGCDPRSITAFERGEYPPADEMLKRLARVLDFPVAFFSGDDLEEPAAATASFRAMSRMPAKVRHSVLAAGTIAFAVSDWVERRFSLPSADLPDFRGETQPQPCSGIIGGSASGQFGTWCTCSRRRGSECSPSWKNGAR